MERGAFLPFPRFWAALIIEKRAQKKIHDRFSEGPFQALDVLGGQKLYDKIKVKPAYPRHFLDILPENNVVKMKYLEGNPMVTPWDSLPSYPTDSPTAHLEEHLGAFSVIGPITKPRKHRGPTRSRSSSQQEGPIEKSPHPRTPVNPASHLASSQQDVTSQQGTPSDVDKVQDPKDQVEKSHAQPFSQSFSKSPARPKGNVPSGTEPASQLLLTGPEPVSGPQQSGTEKRSVEPMVSGQGHSGSPGEDTSIPTSSGPLVTGSGHFQGTTDVSSGAPLSKSLQVSPAVTQTLPQALSKLFFEFGAPNVMVLAQDLASHHHQELIQQVSGSQSMIQGLVISNVYQRALLQAKTVMAQELARKNASQVNLIVDLQAQIVNLQRQVEDQQRQLAIKDTPAALVDVLNFMQKQTSPSTPVAPVQALPEVQDIQKTVSKLAESHDTGLKKLSMDLTAAIARSTAAIQAKIESVAASVVPVISPTMTKGEKRQRSPEEEATDQKRQRKGKEMRESSPVLSDIEVQEDEDLKKAKLASLGLLEPPISGEGGTSTGYEREDLTAEFDTGEDVVDRGRITGPLSPLPIRTYNSEDPALLRQINPEIDSRDKYLQVHARWIKKFRNPKELWSESDIKKVDSCKVRSFEKVIKFLECRITRRDDSVEIINDADFPFLHPNDWKDICDIIGGAISSGRSVPKEDRAIFGRMKQLLNDYVDQWKEHDVDTLALHALPLPQSFQKGPPPNNVNFPDGTILMDPEPGMIYSRKLNKVIRKFFFRFSEVVKYTMTDLNRFARILEDWRPVRNPEERVIVEKFFEELDYQKEVRNNLREMKETLSDHFQKM